MLASSWVNVSRVKQKQAGILSCVRKPFHQTDLMAIICKVMATDIATLMKDDEVQAEIRNTPITTTIRGQALLAEDNLVNQKVAIAMLKKSGLRVEIANNGQQAVDLASIRQFDIILMDCQMPVMDGYKATTLIRQQKKNFYLPIIALTADVLEGDRARCLQAGMN
ncbi:hypothetical protein B566_EDAN019029, partial [Ephemera danica]